MWRQLWLVFFNCLVLKLQLNRVQNCVECYSMVPANPEELIMIKSYFYANANVEKWFGFVLFELSWMKLKHWPLSLQCLQWMFKQLKTFSPLVIFSVFYNLQLKFFRLNGKAILASNWFSHLNMIILLFHSHIIFDERILIPSAGLSVKDLFLFCLKTQDISNNYWVGDRQYWFSGYLHK